MLLHASLAAARCAALLPLRRSISQGKERRRELSGEGQTTSQKARHFLPPGRDLKLSLARSLRRPFLSPSSHALAARTNLPLSCTSFPPTVETEQPFSRSPPFDPPL